MATAKPAQRKLTLLIGTVKGVFLYHTDERRRAWRLTGPHLSGWEIFSVCGAPRRERLLAGTVTYEHGPSIRISDDGGATWRGVKRDPRFARQPKGTKAALNHIWQLVPGPPAQAGTWYAGVDDAALFVSRDDGETWDEVTGLTRHPTRPHWMPGAGGLCLHSIVVDPADARRLWVGISAVGVLRTEDGGATWRVCNAGLPSFVPEFAAGTDVGRCVHKLLLDPVRPGVLHLQYHGGVFRSDNGGDAWTRVSAGLPHDFGFPLAVTQRRDVLVVPLVADTNRVVPDGALKVWRNRNGGRAWRALTQGLPQRDHFVGVLRDAMAADALTPGGVYLGTTGGEVFYTRDDGETWAKLPGSFPRITTVKVWMR